MNQYEALKEEFRKIINNILDEEFNAVLKAAEEGIVTLKDEVSLEDLKASLNKKLGGNNEDSPAER